MHSEWVSVAVIITNIIVGALGGGVFFLNYVILKEILMIFPFNYIDYLEGTVKEDTLKWPSSKTRDSLDYAKLDE